MQLLLSLLKKLAQVCVQANRVLPQISEESLQNDELHYEKLEREKLLSRTLVCTARSFAQEARANRVLQRFLSALVISLLLLANLPAAQAQAKSTFSDLPETHRNFEAINFLQETGIIVGYSDGTFRPLQSVNRAEFLKIILEGSNISLDARQNTPFPDIDNNSWYAPYVKKAFQEKWVIGYPDGTFKPAQTINKVEALKIIAEVQNWQLGEITIKPFEDVNLSDWFVSYVAYAKANNFLEETGKFFSPANLMTRAKISEVIFRTIQRITAQEPAVEKIILIEETQNDPESENTQETLEEIEEIPENPQDNEENNQTENQTQETKPLTQENFTPVKSGNIASDFFTNIFLDQNLPNTFYQGEVFYISGRLEDSNKTEITIIREGKTNNSSQNFTGDLIDGRFSIPVFFEKAGNYNIGILPGTSGESKAMTISVLSNLPAAQNTLTPPDSTGNLGIIFQNNQTKVTLSAPNNTLKKLTFRQNSKSVSYYSRQDLNQIAIQFSDFANFQTGQTSYLIESAKLSNFHPLAISSTFSKSQEKTFQAEEHSFSIIEKDKVLITNLPETISGLSPISFSGTTKTDTKIKALAIRPDGQVDDFVISSNAATSDFFGQTIIGPENNFDFTYTPGSNGRYIIEVNDKNGLAVINHPVYIGGGIPLIPDYFDKTARRLLTNPLNPETAKIELLNLINQSRAEHGLNPVLLDTEISNLAQGHTNDMKTRNFFGHINPDNQSPNDRRIEAGIITSVSENLAQDVSVEFAHFGLMRSAAHRKNILGDSWTRVGLGMSQKTDGYLLVAEEFSTNEISEIDLTNYKQELENGIANLRLANSLIQLNWLAALDNASKFLNDAEIKEGKTIDQNLFTQALQQNNITGASQAIGRTFNVWGEILSSLLSEEMELKNNTWRSIGVDIQLDKSGNIHAILVINNQN